jgi:predicted ATP-binding protein involved in virulence
MMPRVQIIATTHSPLVALGCNPRDLVVLKTDGDIVLQEEKVPDYSGYSAADMLEDDRLFESQIYSTDTHNQLEEYQKLVRLGPDNRKKKDNERLAYLAKILKAQPLPQKLDESLFQALEEVRKELGK